MGAIAPRRNCPCSAIHYTEYGTTIHREITMAKDKKGKKDKKDRKPKKDKKEKKEKKE
jgi:hypothetical protein